MNVFRVSAFIIMLLTIGCSKSNDPKDNEESLKIEIKGIIDPLSKATETGFEDNDKIGVFVSDNQSDESIGLIQDSRVSNVMHTFVSTGSMFTPSTPIFWNGATKKSTIWGFYPYSDTLSVKNTLRFWIKPDQQNIKDYNASDLMLAQASGVLPTTNSVELTFSHSLSKVKLTLKKATDVTTDISSAFIKIDDIYTDVVIDKNSNSIHEGESKKVVQTITLCNKGNSIHEAIVIPGTYNDLKFTVIVDAKSYTTTFSSVIFSVGKQTNFTLIINKNETIALSSGGISDWDKGGDTNTDAKPL